MESKNISLKWNQKDFPKFVLEALIKLNAASKKTKNLNLGLDFVITEDSRYFIYKGVQIEINPGENDFYEFIATPLPTSYEIRFGCELETCFVLNCKTQSFNDFISNSIKETKENKKREEKREQWKDLILFHIKTNLAPYFSKEFLKRFPYAYIMPYHAEEAVYIDLATVEEIFKSRTVDAYKTLQFAQDVSVRCGDTNFSDTSLTVHCEIISPILKDISEIKLIYENIISEDCNSSNSSAGYHVNVSLVDTSDKSKDSKQIKLTPGFLYEICKRWYPFEKKHYTEYRGQGSFYAANMSKITDDVELMQILYEYQEGVSEEISKKQISGSEKIKMNPINKGEILSPENKPGLRNLFYMYRINDKFTSLHRKPNTNILEFRVFPSKTKMDLLIDYTKKAINLIKKSVNYVLENPEKITQEYDSLITRYRESDYFDMDVDEYNYKGSFKIYNKLLKYLTNEDVFEYFADFTTKIEVEEEQETTFLFFFKEKNIVKTKKKIKGLIEGNHKYKNSYIKVRINYIPEEDFIEFS